MHRLGLSCLQLPPWQVEPRTPHMPHGRRLPPPAWGAPGCGRARAGPVSRVPCRGPGVTARRVRDFVCRGGPGGKTAAAGVRGCGAAWLHVRLEGHCTREYARVSGHAQYQALQLHSLWRALVCLHGLQLHICVIWHRILPDLVATCGHYATLNTMATLSILLAVIHLWQHTINIKDHAGCEFACCQEVKSLRVRNQDKLKAKRYV